MTPEESAIWTEAQRLELRHWINGNRHIDASTEDRRESIRHRYERISRLIWSALGFMKDCFSGYEVLEIGAGPTGRCLWFDGTFDAIDPLYAEYEAMEWAQTDFYRQWYGVPAEKLLEECVHQYHAVICMNCLDHCHNPWAVMRNAFEYVCFGGTMFLSCDVGEQVDEMHPCTMGEMKLIDLIEDTGFIIEKQTHGHCYPGKEIGDPWRDNWGGGIANHFWLRKPA